MLVLGGARHWLAGRLLCSALLAWAAARLLHWLVVGLACAPSAGQGQSVTREPPGLLLGPRLSRSRDPAPIEGQEDLLTDDGDDGDDDLESNQRSKGKPCSVSPQQARTRSFLHITSPTNHAYRPREARKAPGRQRCQPNW